MFLISFMLIIIFMLIIMYDNISLTFSGGSVLVHTLCGCGGCCNCDACAVVCVACVYGERVCGCEGDSNAGVGDG